MRMFRNEYRERKGARKKITIQMRKLRGLMLWHYILLVLSFFNAMLALFAVLNTAAPWRPYMLALICASLVLVLYLLFAGLE